jgi:hypothetical protein
MTVDNSSDSGGIPGFSERLRISVVLCTHNPRRDYLDRVISALRLQTAPIGEWEFVIIDNASTNAVLTASDASGIREAKLNRRIGKWRDELSDRELCDIDAVAHDAQNFGCESVEVAPSLFPHVGDYE